MFWFKPFPETTKDCIRDDRLRKKHFFDVVIFDTAGRLGIDVEMMDEIKALHKKLNPIETLFIVDAMQGQDAVNTAKALVTHSL